jgi:hypothetical protein
MHNPSLTSFPCARARLDGLMRREEDEGKKIVETFVGRDDRLVYRSATYLENESGGHHGSDNSVEDE